MHKLPVHVERPRQHSRQAMGQLLTNAHVPDHHTAVTCLSTDSVFLVADTVLIQTVVAAQVLVNSLR